MTRKVAQRWWRRASILVVAGTFACIGSSIYSTATAEPIRTTTGYPARSNPETGWTRSPTAFQAPTTTEPPFMRTAAAAPGPIVPVSATVPVGASGTVTPAGPAKTNWTPSGPPSSPPPVRNTLPLPELDPPVAVPPKREKPAVVEPTVPDPEWGLSTTPKPAAPVAAPAPPKPTPAPVAAPKPATPAAATPAVPDLITPEFTPSVPKTPAPLINPPAPISSKPIPVPTPTPAPAPVNVVKSPTPVPLPAPSLLPTPVEIVTPKPIPPVVAAPTVLTPPAPSVKFAETAPPLPVRQPDFHLRPSESGNTFNSGKPSGPDQPLSVVFPPDLGVKPTPAKPIEPITEAVESTPVVKPVEATPVAKPLELTPLVKPVEPVPTLPIPATPSIELDVPPPTDLAPEPPPLPAPPVVAKPATRATTQPAPAATTALAVPATPVQTPGDPAMIKSLTQAAMTAVLGGAMTLSPTLAQDPGKLDEALKKKLDESDKLIQDNTRKLEETTKLLAEVQKRLDDLKDLKEKIYGRRDEKGFPIETERGLAAELKSLNDKVFDLTNQITAMKSQSLKPDTAKLPDTTSGSTKITIPGPMPPGPGPAAIVTPPTASGKGVIKLVNEYPIEISMVINKDVSYKIAPHSTKQIDVTAGEFTYELLQSGAGPIKSSIKDRETVTLRIK